jgi:hypothetical protein
MVGDGYSIYTRRFLRWNLITHDSHALVDVKASQEGIFYNVTPKTMSLLNMILSEAQSWGNACDWIKFHDPQRLCLVS